MTSTRSHRHIRAPRHTVYAALLDPHAVARWRVPAGMTSEVHAFDPRVGGRVRVSLTYEAADAVGKTSAYTDTYRGRFVELVPDRRVVEALEFETADPALQGEMTIAISLCDAAGGTAVDALHASLSAGLSAADNAAGWRSALDRLAALLEAG
jgi:uncharacterized protein YndB with AHSA1/START domain